MLARIMVVVAVISIANSSWAGDGSFGYVYTDFGANASPAGIVAGPDGAMWFTDQANAAIGRITVDGTPSSFPLESSASFPVFITVGPDGNLWFTDSGRNAIGRITVRGESNEFPIPGFNFPADIVAGSDGNLWFTTDSGVNLTVGPGGGTIGRITPNGTISLFPVDNPTLSITNGPDGALWVSSFMSIGRITTAGQGHFFPLDTSSLDVTTGPDGALWFTNACLLPVQPAGVVPPPCGPTGLGRVTTGGELTQFVDIGPEADPRSITRGPEDNLWFVRADGRITRVNLAGTVDDIVFNLAEIPTDLAIGPDGGIWFTQPTMQRIGRVMSLAFNFITIADSAPLGMAPGLDGSVWFTDEDGNRVGHLGRAGSFIQYELGADHAPTAIAAAPDGGAYFTNFGAGTIGRITPEGEFVEFALPFPDDSPEDIVRGPDGNYWFTIDVNSIGRITPEGAVKIFHPPTEDAGPGGITVGADGNLWFTEFIANNIGRMKTDGSAVEFPIPTADTEPWDIAAGPDGALYFTESGIGRVARITTDGMITELGAPNPFASPRDIALGPDGALWFSIAPLQPDTGGAAADSLPRPNIAEDPTPTPTLGPAKLGRVARDGRITTFNLPVAETSPAGIAGSADGQLFVALNDSSRIAVIDLAAAEPTRTATPTSNVPVSTPTPGEGACPGDCDGDHGVSISELITAVNIALGNQGLETCVAADADGDGALLINELISAVTRALQGC